MRFVEVANSFGRVYRAASLSSILSWGRGGGDEGRIGNKFRESPLKVLSILCEESYSYFYGLIFVTV